MMYDMPTAPFTMNLLPPMGEENREVFESLKAYSATKYGRPIAEVEREINERMTVKKPEAPKIATEHAEELVNALPSSKPEQNPMDSRPMVNAATDQRDRMVSGAMNASSGVAAVGAPARRPSYLDRWKKPMKTAAGAAAGANGGVGVQKVAPNQAKPQKGGQMSDGDVIRLH
jgi:hypothetical protein